MKARALTLARGDRATDGFDVAVLILVALIGLSALADFADQDDATDMPVPPEIQAPR